MIKLSHGMLVILGAYIAIMMAVVAMIVVLFQTTAQCVSTGAYIAIAVASIAIIATVTFEWVLHVRQSRENSEYHKEQMDAIKRLEDYLKKNRGWPE